MAVEFGGGMREASGFGVRFLAFQGFSLRIQDISNSNDVVVRISGLVMIVVVMIRTAIPVAVIMLATMIVVWFLYGDSSRC